MAVEVALEGESDEKECAGDACPYEEGARDACREGRRGAEGRRAGDAYGDAAFLIWEAPAAKAWVRRAATPAR